MLLKSKTCIVIFLVFIVFIDFANAQPVWQNNHFKIFLKNNVLELLHEKTKIIEIQSIEFNFIKPDTILVQEVKADSLTLKLMFNETDGFNPKFPSEILLTISQFNNTFHFYSNPKGIRHVSIKMKDLNEHYFGLIEKLYPNNLKSPDLRGNVVDVDVSSDGNRDYAENYASAYSAFYMSSLGYGSFFDTFAKGRYQLAINGMTQIYHQTGVLDWYIFYGPTGDIIHNEYFRIIGKPKYVPIWACGPIFWRDENKGGKNEILDDIKKFTELKIPLTSCWVDRPYSNGTHAWSKMDFNDNFSEPEKWIKTINDKYNLEFMTWIGPLTFGDSNFPGLLPNYRGYIDLTHPDALKEFEDRMNRYQYSVGVKGHKMDRADQNFPFAAHWYQRVSESESRNKYVYLFSKVIHGFLSNSLDRDQFSFARAAFHRCQPFLSAVWGGDSRSNWQGMAGNQANAIRCSYMGFPVWGTDTGGYLGPGRIDEKLYMRWLQWGAWNGLFEIKIDGAGGSGKDRAPWNYSEQLQNVFRNVCELRMQLLPYIYSCVNTSYMNGVLMKPLTYMFPNDENAYHIWDEYIFGKAFLIAPVFSKDDSREVYLPKGKWYDFYDQKNEYNGPTTLTQKVHLETIPIFIKENSIYITGQIYQGNSKVWENDINGNEKIAIHLFPGEVNDQTTFNYIDYFDNDKEKIMTLNHQSNKIIFTSEALMTKSTIELKCKTKPMKILLNNENTRYEFDNISKMTKVNIKKYQNIRLEILHTP